MDVSCPARKPPCKKILEIHVLEDEKKLKYPETLKVALSVSDYSAKGERTLCWTVLYNRLRLHIATSTLATDNRKTCLHVWL